MLIDRPNVVEGTFIKNATVPSGLLAPPDASEGELYVFEDNTATGSAGLHVFLGSVWEIVPAGTSVEAIDSHLVDTTLHLTPSQNALLDGLAPTLTAAELNFVDGVTSPIQAQFIDQTAALNTHESNLDLHLTPSQNALLDGLAPTLTAAELNFVDGVTSPIQAQLNAASGTSLAHFSDTNLHLSEDQNAFVDALNFSVETPAQKATAVNALSGHLASTALHLSADQNTFVDALNLPTLTAADVNRVAGLNAFLTSSGQTNLSVALASKVTRSGDTMSGNLLFTSGTVTGIPLPINPLDAANKAYVDALAGGIDWKQAVKAATTEPIALSGAPVLIDDVVINPGDRVLVKDQATPSTNGIYLASASAWSRAPDYDTDLEISQSAVYVLNGGSVNGRGSYVQTSNITSFPGDPIIFSPFSGPVVNSAGNGIILGVGGLVAVKEARGITFDGSGNVEADIFPGHLIFTTDGATASSAATAQIGLANTGVTPGTYRSITVDTKGRVTAGTNPTTLAGYGITDAQPLDADLTSLAAISTTGVLVRTAAGTATTRSIDLVGTGLTITNGNGVSGNPTITSSATSVNSPNTIVLRDASGNFTAGVMTGSASANVLKSGDSMTGALILNADPVAPLGAATKQYVDNLGVGNASTATTLQTARSINGTNFDGSQNITTSSWGVARTLTIGSTDKSVNGSANVAWSLSEIGAASNVTPNITGAVTIVGPNAAVELGTLNLVNTPYIDFHSGAIGIDYDSRIIASGGNGALGGGSIQILASTISLTATAVTSTGTITGSNLSGTNTGDESATTIRTKLGITTLSGSNTGDQDLSGKQDLLVSGTNIRTVNGQGLLGSGNLSVGDVTLTGVQTLTNKTLTGTRETRVTMPASNIDLNAGNYFTRTISGATTLSVSNVPESGTAVSFILDLTNGGSSAITWWAGVRWAGGTAPTLTAAGRDVLGFFTYDAGANWTGLVLGRDVR